MSKSTEIHYPLILSEPLPGFRLFIPDPDQVKIVYEQRRGTDPDTPFPFWARIWPAARALTSYLQEQPELYKDKSVLEIGAGIGLPSFRIAGEAASVCITDHDPEALALLKENIARSQYGKLHALLLDWNQPPGGINAELVLCSDLNYAPDQFPGLIRLIRHYILSGSTVLLATPERIMAAAFVETLMPYCRQQLSRTVTDENGQTLISLFLLSETGSVTAEKSSSY